MFWAVFICSFSIFENSQLESDVCHLPYTWCLNSLITMSVAYLDYNYHSGQLQLHISALWLVFWKSFLCEQDRLESLDLWFLRTYHSQGTFETLHLRPLPLAIQGDCSLWSMGRKSRLHHLDNSHSKSSAQEKQARIRQLKAL